VSAIPAPFPLFVSPSSPGTRLGLYACTRAHACVLYRVRIETRVSRAMLVKRLHRFRLVYSRRLFLIVVRLFSRMISARSLDQNVKRGLSELRGLSIKSLRKSLDESVICDVYSGVNWLHEQIIEHDSLLSVRSMRRRNLANPFPSFPSIYLSSRSFLTFPISQCKSY